MKATQKQALDVAKKLSWEGWVAFSCATGAELEEDGEALVAGWIEAEKFGLLAGHDRLISGDQRRPPGAYYDVTELGHGLVATMNDHAKTWGAMATSLYSMEKDGVQMDADAIPGAVVLGVPAATAVMLEYGFIVHDPSSGSNVFPYKTTVFCHAISLWQKKRLPMSLESLAEGISLSDAAQACLQLGADLRTLAVLDQVCRVSIDDATEEVRSDIAMRLLVIQKQASLLYGFLDMFLERTPKMIADLSQEPAPSTH